MPERDYLDYQDYQRDDPYNWDGHPQNPNLYAPPVPWDTMPPPAGTTPQPTTPPTTTGGGKTPQQIEAEGREYDRQHGLIGGYMLDGRWVNGSPSSSGPKTNTEGETNPLLPSDGTEPPPFNWSQFHPTPFSSKYGAYTPTTMAEAESDPGYQFSRDQGRKTLENSAAGRGVLRTGGTLKDILEYGNKFAEQNYSSVDNRRFRNWGANTDNEFRTYDVNYRGEKDSFDALHDSERLSFSDAYQRWKSKLDSLTQITTAGLNS